LQDLDDGREGRECPGIAEIVYEDVTLGRKVLHGCVKVSAVRETCSPRAKGTPVVHARHMKLV
jgi:hypothetical protein